MSVLAHGSVKLGGNVLALEYLRGQENLEQQVSPNSMPSLSMPSTSPYYPGNGIYPSAPGQSLMARIALAFRGFETGPSQSSARTVTDRALVQFTGYAAGFDYEATRSIRRPGSTSISSTDIWTARASSPALPAPAVCRS